MAEVASYRSIEPSHRWARPAADSAFARLIALADRETLLRLLEHDSPVVRATLATHVCEERRDDLAALYPLLADDRPVLVGSPCCVSDFCVGAHVARVLGFVAEGEVMLQTTASERAFASALLARAAKDVGLPDFARAAAVEALVRAAVESAPTLLQECLASDRPEVVRAALSGARLLTEADRRPALGALRAHASPAVRAAVLGAYRETRDPELADACHEAIARDDDATVRLAATRALPIGSQRALEAALLAVRDPVSDVRDAALRWLIDENLEVAAPFVFEDISRPDERIAVDSIGPRHALFRPRGAGADAIARHLISLDGPLVELRREFIAEALTYVGEQRLVDCAPHVRRHLASWDEMLGDRAARTAGRLGDREAIGLIEARLKRFKRASLEGAAEAAAELGSVGSLPLLRAALRIALASSRPVILRSIERLEALEEAQRKGLWPSIQRALRRATER